MSHYFVDDPDLRSERRSFDYTFGNEHFTFTTDLGVFSKEHVDFGSYLLIRYVLGLPLGGKILDLGCGFGPIGIILKRFFPEAEIDLVDVNPRAVELSRLNAAANRADVQVCLTDDITTLQKHYHSILLNPPIRAGKATIYGLYEKSREVLYPGGTLYIVIRKKKGAESTIRKLKELFNDAEVLAKDSGYWILRAVKADAQHLPYERTAHQ